MISDPSKYAYDASRLIDIQMQNHHTQVRLMMKSELLRRYSRMQLLDKNQEPWCFKRADPMKMQALVSSLGSAGFHLCISYFITSGTVNLRAKIVVAIKPRTTSATRQCHHCGSKNLQPGLVKESTNSKLLRIFNTDSWSPRQRAPVCMDTTVGTPTT